MIYTHKRVIIVSATNTHLCDKICVLCNQTFFCRTREPIVHYKDKNNIMLNNDNNDEHNTQQFRFST